MARTCIVVLLSVLLSVRWLFAQAPGAAAPGPEVAPANVDLVDELRREKERRAREKENIEKELKKKEDELTSLRFEEKQLDARVPAAKQAYDEAKQKVAEAYEALSAASLRKGESETQARKRFIEDTLARYRQEAEAAYAKQKAQHERDTAFVDANRIRAEDIDGLVLRMDPADPRRTLVFQGCGSGTVTGQFSVIRFEKGDAVWYSLPPTGARFAANVNTDNPFQADVVIDLGTDMLQTGSTNSADWCIHVYVAKYFKPRPGAASRFGHTAVRWSERHCHQVAEVPVFQPTDMPEAVKIDETTPKVKAELDAWKFDDQGKIALVKDAERALSIAKQEEKIKQNFIGRTERDVTGKKGKLAEKIKTAEDELAQLKAKLAEFADEVQAPDVKKPAEGETGGPAPAAPPPPAAGAPAAGAAPPAAPPEVPAK